jgi:hypothetical protein
MKRKQLSLTLMIFSLCCALMSCKTTLKALDTGKANEKDGLQLMLSMNKKSYRSNEIMPATIQLKNILSDGRSILICKWLYDWYALDFVISDESGKRANEIYMIEVRLPETFDFVKINTGEAVEYTRDIHDSRKPLNPGKYTVQAIYQNRLDPDPGDYTDKVNVKSAWKGTLESNIVTITIKP